MAEDQSKKQGKTLEGQKTEDVMLSKPLKELLSEAKTEHAKIMEQLNQFDTLKAKANFLSGHISTLELMIKREKQDGK